jgi:HEPN domain-containing protein
MKPETERWVGRGDEDLKVAGVALERGWVSTSIFHSHEAVEKTLKAIWIETRGEQPEKTHNLPYLARELQLDVSAQQMEFLRKLYWQLIPSRYPEGSEPDREAAQWYYEHAKELVSWLRQALK